MSPLRYARNIDDRSKERPTAAHVNRDVGRRSCTTLAVGHASKNNSRKRLHLQ